MITSFELHGAPCFDPVGVEVPLRINSFIFGPNGSGKTTISRLFDDQSPQIGSFTVDGDDSPLNVRVYNRDYVQATLAASEDLPGVFLLGEDSHELQNRIRELGGTSGEVAKGRGKMRRLRDSLGDTTATTGVLGEMAESLGVLQASAWKQKKSSPQVFNEVFRGYNSDKSKFVHRLLDLHRENSTTQGEDAESLDSILEAATTVFHSGAAPLEHLPRLGFPEPLTSRQQHLLTNAIVGSRNVALAGLIEKLGHENWVSAGRSLLSDAEGCCPFCQQELPVGFEDRITAYFDTAYETNMGELRSFSDQYSKELSTLRKTARQIIQSPPGQLDNESFASAWTALDEHLTQNEARIGRKLLSPAESIELRETAVLEEPLTQAIRNANLRIDDHNNRIRNREIAAKEVMDRGWRFFAREVMGGELSAYEHELSSRNRRATSLRDQIARESARVEAYQSELHTLQLKATSSARTVKFINDTLSSMGFIRFELKESTSESGGYMLVRPDGTLASESLSEGERTLITFLYFYYHLNGLSEDPNDVSGFTVVVDDPISSLDSDVMYLVTSLVRDIAIRAASKTDRVTQLIVLTHNAHFYKEVSYEGSGYKLGFKQFAVIEKSSEGHSTINCYDQNPVKSAYERLWGAVREAHASPNQTSYSIGLENVLRRILENYFKILGDIDEHALIGGFAINEQVVCRALFSWANAGSHALVEDLEYAPSQRSTEFYLRVFRKIFELSGHPGHYDMMMKSEPTPDTKQTEAAAPWL